MHKADGFGSFAAASADLHESLDVHLSAKHLERLCHRIGQEWAEHRDRQVAAYKARQLKRDHPKTAPMVAAVMVDSGKVQTRREDQPPGVHEPSWKNTNVACCLTLKSPTYQRDPQPEPPRKFLDPPKVLRIVTEIHARSAGPGSGKSAPLKAADKGQPGAVAGGPRKKRRRSADPRPRKGPIRLLRTTVATMQDWDHFGWQVGAEVHRRSLDLASRKACVGDGQPCNWTLYEMHLRASGFVAILDILHLLGYLYAAALAAVGTGTTAAWQRYEQWLRLAWSGQSRRLLEELKAAASRLGPPPPDAPESDPRQILAEAVGYVRHNQGRMDYPRYRKLGLPISSAPVESVIKQYNRRIKGTEKFWLSVGAEAMQQIRAAYLSDDDRAERNWKLPRPYRHAVGTGRLHSMVE